MLQKTSAATDMVARYPSLIDKRVIVTGGGSGIGEGWSRRSWRRARASPLSISPRTRPRRWSTG